MTASEGRTSQEDPYVWVSASASRNGADNYLSPADRDVSRRMNYAGVAAANVLTYIDPSLVDPCREAAAAAAAAGLGGEGEVRVNATTTYESLGRFVGGEAAGGAVIETWSGLAAQRLRAQR